MSLVLRQLTATGLGVGDGKLGCIVFLGNWTLDCVPWAWLVPAVLPLFCLHRKDPYTNGVQGGISFL